MVSKIAKVRSLRRQLPQRHAIGQFTLALLLGMCSSFTAAQSGAPIKIATSIDLSGAAANLGKDALEGMQYAVDVLNSRGGVIGRPVVLNYQDNGTNAQRAVNQANSLARDGAVLLLAPISSGSTVAVSKTVSGKLKIPLCVAVSGADEITIKEFDPYTFSLTPNGYMEARANAVRLAKEPYKRYALLAVDSLGGRAPVLRFKEFLKELNPQAEIVVEEYAKFGSTDFTSSINKILAARPDYVYSMLFGTDLMTFSKQATALGFFKQINYRFMAMYDGNTLKALGDSAGIGTEAVQRAPAYYFSKSTPQAQAYVAQFKAKTGSYPSDWTTLAYDCVMTWAQAANAAKSTDSDAVMRAIETMQFNSPRGTFRFGKYDHEAEVPVFVGKLEQSKDFGQPVVAIEHVIPPQVTRPSEAVVQKMRHE